MKIRNIIYSAAAAAMVAGCSLDEVPYGFYSQDNFYQTEADAESGLMYAYNALNYLEYLRGIWYLGDIPSEAMYPKSSEPGDIHMLQDWTVTPETELTLYYFKYCYIGINRANTVITIEGIVKNDDTAIGSIDEMDAVRVWTATGSLHVQLPRPMPVRVVNYAGQVIRSWQAVEGDQAVSLPDGAYIVIAGDRHFKVVL